MKIVKFFDVLEDKIRAHLSRYPLIYALIGGVGVVLFWRGVWNIADGYPFLTGPVSALIGVTILGLTGILVSAFIGNSIIMAGLKGEKKQEEKTQSEILEEQSQVVDIASTLTHIESELADIRDEVHHE